MKDFESGAFLERVDHYGVVTENELRGPGERISTYPKHNYRDFDVRDAHDLAEANATGYV